MVWSGAKYAFFDIPYFLNGASCGTNSNRNTDRTYDKKYIGKSWYGFNIYGGSFYSDEIEDLLQYMCSYWLAGVCENGKPVISSYSQLNNKTDCVSMLHHHLKLYQNHTAWAPNSKGKKQTAP